MHVSGKSVMFMLSQLAALSVPLRTPGLAQEHTALLKRKGLEAEKGKLIAGNNHTARAEGGAGTVVRVGKGSYTLTAPRDMKLPPRRIFQTDNVTARMQTTDWWSSLAWETFSSNQFPHPLGIRAVKGGVRVSYPAGRMHGTPKHVFASFKNELVLGHSKCGEFPDARVDGFSDWFVDVLFAANDCTMRLSYGHGSPFVYGLYENGGAAVRFDGAVKIFAGGAGTSGRVP